MAKEGRINLDVVKNVKRNANGTALGKAVVGGIGTLLCYVVAPTIPQFKNPVHAQIMGVTLGTLVGWGINSMEIMIGTWSAAFVHLLYSKGWKLASAFGKDENGNDLHWWNYDDETDGGTSGGSVTDKVLDVAGDVVKDYLNLNGISPMRQIEQSGRRFYSGRQLNDRVRLNDRVNTNDSGGLTYREADELLNQVM